MNDSIIEKDVSRMMGTVLDHSYFAGKTILISGANGYVPAYFVHYFMGLNDTYHVGIRVIALCRNENRANERFANYLGRDDFSLYIQDVCSAIEISEEINFFIHAAGTAGAKERYVDIVNTFGANVFGVKNMLDIAAKNPCKGFLVISSVDVYGYSEKSNHWSEEELGFLDSLNMRNIYSCAKRAMETLAIAYKETYNVPVYIVRPVQIIGPGPNVDDGRLHIDFVSQIIRDNKIVLKSDGKSKRSFIYITDAITAMLTVLLKGKSGEAYNISSRSGEATVLELANIMAKVSNRDVKIQFDMKARNNIEVKTAVPEMVCDPTKLYDLGWEPQIEIEEGCKRMFDYYSVNEV